MTCKQNTRQWSGLVVIAGLMTCIGCVGISNQLLYTFKDHKTDALFNDLQKKTVAVVVTSGSGYAREDPGGDVARKLSEMLDRNVKGIEIVNQYEVADWLDQNGLTDVKKLGIGVKADLVVSVEFTGLSFSDSSTIVKGRSDFTVSVFNVHTGKRVFFQEEIEHEYPKNGPAGHSRRKFRGLYTSILASHIARYFYAHPIDELYGNDARAI
ncbi:MAG TPA: hypothetical protein EYG57_19120 [Planctomycetes bacterium]|nr:hypothetical protein [Planctomycetaceae bacterium]HIM31648.1 hypothetical protein [Planctomycetota bacterium]